MLYVFPIFETAEVGQKDGCGPQTQLRGAALGTFIVDIPAGPWYTRRQKEAGI